ncbi:polysaccharide deacetylase family protein [Dyadobacter arcticus]|uniref:Peptidoglycan/xylan/chitin deacetylase (PgdA/CDA1 family) n=1 Tax=Dyadobacter arcticus TaxID=1078754 RepID=A0ABX0UHW9_9BACT|nr:polysaccharide deacetylase family protein [Dyadobacter arcticus]NIJ52512.1 peptidoglycan/xylan/chitin deacetylase (PgdA/CDA1 family) [Dyadobacter arcticus]
MFLHYSPFWLKVFFPGFIWRVPTQEKKIFLTFDDGPIPQITDWVLDMLEQYNAKATFFCIGENVRKHPDIFQKILENAHSIGNHTHNHMNGWETDDKTYLENIEKCAKQLDLETNLFRPPYGRVKRSQSKVVSNERKIIMWDVLSGDFSKVITPETCLKKTIQHTRPGSIILFHDSIKAAKNMQYALPRFLEHFTQKGFSFEALPMS